MPQNHLHMVICLFVLFKAVGCLMYSAGMTSQQCSYSAVFGVGAHVEMLMSCFELHEIDQ